MADIVYTLENSVYMNITNKCPCSCVFCIRANGNGVGSAESLWLDKDPDLDDIISEIDKFDFSDYSEVVYCGYGEPTEQLDNLIESARYLKNKYHLKIRLNTNGLSDMINNKSTAELLSEVVDTVSISLNAPDSETYCRVSNPVFGTEAFNSLLKFANDCKKYIQTVKFTVVDIISSEEIEKCRQLSSEMNIPLRVRKYIK